MSLSTDYSRFQSRSNLTYLDLPQLNDNACSVLKFWFDDNNEPYWFEKNDAFDKQIEDKFGEIWQAAKRGECASWRHSDSQIDTNSPVTNLAGRLAEIIVLDQFSRNICREQACAFAQDNMALVLAQEAIHQPYFADLPMQWRQFMILPFMHSESLAIHKNNVVLFEQLDDANTLDFEHKHLAIIERFGRYPHRNAVLGRQSTSDELAFLQQPDSSF